MTNFEKYKDEILKIVNETHDIPAMEDGHLQKCSLTSCQVCEFEDKDRNGCGGNFTKWLYENACEKPDGCNDCEYEYKRENESPCAECCNNYTSKWKYKSKKIKQDKLLEVFPKARMHNGIVDVCPKLLNISFDCEIQNCMVCSQNYWRQEVE